MVAFLTGLGLVGGSKAAPFLNITSSLFPNWSPTTNGTVKTANNVGIGPASADRYVIVVTGRPGGTSNASINKLTIAGIEADEIYAPSPVSRIFGALIPTSTIADIQVFITAAATDLRIPMLVYSLTNYTDLTPAIIETFGSGLSSSPSSGSLSCSGIDGGVNLQGMWAITGNAGVGPTSLTLSPSFGSESSSSSGGQGSVIGNAGRSIGGAGETLTGTETFGSGSAGSIRLFNLVWV